MVKRIYLASGSKARRKLLEDFGLKFKVMPSRIKERRSLNGRSYAGLVKENALNKAREVERRVKDGVIIAADTIVVQKGVIFGKPSNLADARRMLKTLSAKPHWLYSGLAVIDRRTNRAAVDYEKTRIYMDKLSDRQIKEYFRSVSPMDKAGSFDIQGRGALFIRRIEGCFYNVVGLPIRKLYWMLKEVGVKVFILAFCALSFTLCAFLSGCSSEYNIVTGEQELYYYSTDKEVRLGTSIDRQLMEEFEPVEDPLVQKRVEDIGKRIVSVCDRKDIDYSFKVIDEEEVNAISLPGGFVYIYRGLVDKAGSDDELAGVIAHEVGHIVARHSIKKLQGYQGYSLLRILIAQAPVSGSGGAANAADAAFMELLLGYAREDELLADQLGARYSKLAGYDPQGMIDFLIRLREDNRRKPLREFNYYKTHPYIPDRLRVVKEEMGGKMNFSDYINIEQLPHE